MTELPGQGREQCFFFSVDRTSSYSCPKPEAQVSFLTFLFLAFFIFKYILLNILLQLSHFTPLFPSALHTRSYPHFPSPLSSCPGIVHTNSSASTFLILFLTSPCLFCTYHLCFLFPVSFPPFSPLPLPTDNPPCDLHFCDSVPVLVVCLVCFCFFRFGC